MKLGDIKWGRRIFFSLFVVLGGWLLLQGVTFSQDKGEDGEIIVPADITIDVRGERLKKFPCSQCHNLIPEGEGRRSSAHPEVIMNHGNINKNCLVCHDTQNRNKLRLFEPPRTVSYEESYLVCGQCHGTILQDWNSGIHGLQTGSWNGKKLRRTCTECHDPHNPKFKAMKPMPAPKLPKGKKGAH